MNCNHTFPYWSVIPPSHCPCCGACLHPVLTQPRQPSYPTWPYWGPFYTVTSTNTAAPSANGTVCSAIS